MGDGVPLWVTGRGKAQFRTHLPIGGLPGPPQPPRTFHHSLTVCGSFHTLGLSCQNMPVPFLISKTPIQLSKPISKSPLLSFTLWARPALCPSLHPSLDHTGLCVSMSSLISSTRDSGRGGGRLPGWGVDGRRRPPLAIFLASFDILHLPAHGVPFHGEIIHPQVLVGCGRIQAEHERWGQADAGVTEMGKPGDTETERDRQ